MLQCITCTKVIDLLNSGYVILEYFNIDFNWLFFWNTSH